MIFEQSDAIKRLPEQFFADLNNRVQQLVDEGHDVINLGQGNPDLPTEDRIVEALREAALDPVNHKYPPFQGFPYFKEAVADFYKREYDVDLNPNTEVALMFGSKIGIFEVVQSVMNPGDTALLPDPGYPDYLASTQLSNIKNEYMSLLEENNFLPDYTTIPEDVAERAKLMFLNYPNNPTAAVATEEFFEETVSFAKKHKIFVVHDFAYGALSFDEYEHPSFLQADGAKEVGIELYSMSKTFNMAGWRVAFAVGNASVIQTINELQDHLFTSLFGGIQYAATEAISGDLSYVQELVKTYERRRDVLVSRLRKIGWDVTEPKGTFFAWFKVPEGYTSEQFANILLEKAHVVVAAGNGFGPLGEGYVRFGLLDTEERLIEAVERIGKLNLF